MDILPWLLVPLSWVITLLLIAWLFQTLSRIATAIREIADSIKAIEVNLRSQREP